jgi:hypothetical protein
MKVIIADALRKAEASTTIFELEVVRFVVGLAGFEPTTFTRKQRLAAPTGFFR